MVMVEGGERVIVAVPPPPAPKYRGIHSTPYGNKFVGGAMLRPVVNYPPTLVGG